MKIFFAKAKDIMFLCKKQVLFDKCKIICILTALSFLKLKVFMLIGLGKSSLHHERGGRYRLKLPVTS